MLPYSCDPMRLTLKDFEVEILNLKLQENDENIDIIMS